MSDPTCEIGSQQYKIGLHGLVYKWSFVYKEWRRSTFSKREVENALHPTKNRVIQSYQTQKRRDL